MSGLRGSGRRVICRMGRGMGEMIMSGLTYTRVIDVQHLRPLTRAYVPMRRGGYAWLSVTGVTWGPGGVWGVQGTDEHDRHLVSAWSDARTVEVW